LQKIAILKRAASPKNGKIEIDERRDSSEVGQIKSARRLVNRLDHFIVMSDVVLAIIL
jgi:hypothetical protein